MREVEVRGLFNLGNPMKLRFEDDESSQSQDEEWFEVLQDGAWRRLRIHDYDEVYDIPGLYEAVVYRVLKCVSPTVVVSALREAVVLNGEAPEGLRVLDFGAGNGMAGVELRNIGVESVIGSDIIPQAKAATARERHYAYDDYVVADFRALTPEETQRLRREHLNCLVIVAALGFGDIPSAAFLTALDLVESPGWVAFNIKEDFLETTDTSGFAGLLQQLAAAGVLQRESFRRYQHRVSFAGTPLHYGVMVAHKLKPVPGSFFGR
jgi:SAM-dependent methyltransferase